MSTVEGAETQPDVSLETEAAFQSLADKLAVTTPSKSKSINLKTAATRAHRLYEQAHKPDAAAKFAKLPQDLFDHTHLALLQTCARAASYVYGMQQDAKALKREEEARLPPDLVQDATTLKTEMLTVIDYVLGKNPEVSTLLVDIRSGRGYPDLATDLDRLARLYKRHQEVLAQDRLRYRAEDADRARALDRSITETLDASRRAQIKHWAEQAAKVTTLLRTSFEEVAEAGHWLLRTSPDRDARFPSLFAGQGGYKRSKKTDAPPPADAPTTAPST